MRNILDILYNFHWIVDQEAGRSSQAYAGFLARFLTRHRVQAVINLRGANPRFWWWRYEKSVCARLDVQHFDVRLNSRNLPPQRILLDLMEGFGRAARPVLIKCSGGQDRASFASALYIVHCYGWDAARHAQRHFAAWPYLHWPKRQQRWLEVFLQYAEGSAQGKSLSSWLRDDYVPEHFRHWLLAREMGDYFRSSRPQPPEPFA